MRNPLFSVIGVAAIITAVAGLLKMTGVPVESQTPADAKTGGAVASASPAPRTVWGEPDLQGIWTDPYQTPLQRPAQFAGKELFTDLERRGGTGLGGPANALKEAAEGGVPTRAGRWARR